MDKVFVVGESECDSGEVNLAVFSTREAAQVYLESVTVRLDKDYNGQEFAVGPNGMFLGIDEVPFLG